MAQSERVRMAARPGLFLGELGTGLAWEWQQGIMRVWALYVGGLIACAFRVSIVRADRAPISNRIPQ